MLAAAFVQAEPVLGTTFTYGSPPAAYTGFFSIADEHLNMELTGELDQIDFAIVTSTAQFVTAPATGTQLAYGGANYLIRTMRADPSAYVLGLKKISV